MITKDEEIDMNIWATYTKRNHRIKAKQIKITEQHNMLSKRIKQSKGEGNLSQ